MESERVLHLVLQYLAETYPTALKALEEESNVLYCEDNMKYGSELVTILNDYHEIMGAEGNEDKKKEYDDELLVEGTGNFASKVELDLAPEVHQNAAILSVAFNNHPDNLLFATGATDKTVRVFDYATKERIWQITPHIAGVTTLAFNPVYHGLLLTGSMDATHVLFDTTEKVQLQLFKDHKKFVVRSKWHPNGKSFATGSYDHTICIYASEDPTKGEFVLQKRLEFGGNVEALDYSPDGSYLIASIRDDNYLQYIDTTTFEITKNNMNSNGDDHVSFTALDISVSPSGKHILVSTDKDRLILYRFNSETQVRNFYGASNDILSQPRVCWHPSGKYIYATSQDKAIYVWDVVTQKIVHKLTGHSAIPRSMDLHPKTGYLISGGFDKRIKSWIA